MIFNLMLSEGRGGLETMAFLYADAVARLGVKSVMLCHKASSYASKEPAVTRIADFSTSLFNPLNYYRLYKSIAKYRPELIMCHGRRAILLALCVLRFVKHKPKIIGVAHSSRLKDFNKLDGVIAVSKSVRDWLVGKYGVHESKIMSCENATEVPDTISVKTDRSEVVIGFIGRFHAAKGIDVLLKAVAKLKDAGKNFRVVLAGDGSIAKDLKHLATELQLSDRIEWLGWMSEKENFYSQVDIAVVPSRSEPFGLTLIEAMSYQCAVVVSDCEAPRQIVENSKCGLVFKREDADGLANCLEKLIDNPELRAEFAAKGRSAALCDYSLSRFDRNLHDCIDAFVEGISNHNKINLSVIVPVYNAEKYLARCLDSILAAAKVATEVETEIICVNDGSTDSSAAVLEKYTDKVRVFHKENGGQGSARNLGLDNMTGDFVMFVDADDYIPEDTIWKMCHVADKSGLPMVVSMRMSKNHLPSRMKAVKWEVHKNDWLVGKKIEYSVCNRLYKASIFANRRMPKILFEDYPTAVNICTDIEKFASIDEPMYVYCDNGESTTIRSPYSKRKLKDKLTGVRLIMEHKGAFSGDIPERQAVKGVSTVIGKVAKAKDPMLIKLLLVEILRFSKDYPSLLKMLPLKSKFRLWKMKKSVA